MTSFALICEGITDQAALESILFGYYDDPDLEINSLQPLRDATDESRQGAFGGWERVLEYCQDHEAITEALTFNDYLIIQIDTDICDHENFGVNKLDADGKDKDEHTLRSDVRFVLEELLGDRIMPIFGNRVFFAICVHSLECWLIPLHVSDKRMARKTKSCETHLGRALLKASKDFCKTYSCYQSISRGYEKRKVIDIGVTHNQSFSVFLSSLP